MPKNLPLATQVGLLKKYRIPVRGHSGQHLLIDPNLQRKIVDLLAPVPRDRILEIGPGLGALTGEILKRGAKVWAVEKDRRFVEILQNELPSALRKNVKLIHGDILEFDLDDILRHPEPAKGRRRISRSFGPAGLRMTSGFKVVSNLPYYITAPVLFHLFRYHRLISTAVLTMQKEVARRLLALPGTKDYGRLTLAVRYHAYVEHAFDIPPDCFTPRPEVDSSVLKLRFHRESERAKHVDETFLFRLIQLAFSQRRKTLFHLLAKDARIGRSRDELLEFFRSLGLSPTVRGEELLLKDYLLLADRLA